MTASVATTFALLVAGLSAVWATAWLLGTLIAWWPDTLGEDDHD